MLILRYYVHVHVAKFKISILTESAKCWIFPDLYGDIILCRTDWLTPSLQGTVIIIANHGDRIDIPSGAMLENKIVSGNLRILDH